MNKPQILRVCGREILDSRGNPTVEATVCLTDGSVGVASVPSGASTGIYEAHEKRDGDADRYDGKGVTEAVRGIATVISPALSGISAAEQPCVDYLLRNLDGTENKSHLGANAILAVSIASARAAANFYHQPLYRYLGGINVGRCPVPMMNILNGGAHASNSVEIQEFMIVPVGADSFADAMRIGSEIYHTLGRLLKKEGYATTVGDEGGFAPDLASDEEALDLLVAAIKETNYATDDVKIALDVAASEWCQDGKNEKYEQPKHHRILTRDALIDSLSTFCDKYPILSIEDGLDQRDFAGWRTLTERLGDRVMLVGDDLFVTNTARLLRGVDAGAANAVLVKPNQIGTLTETLQLIAAARENNYRYILSHRSGDTEDTTLADLAVAVSAPYIKTGAPCRSERVAKYNRLLRIESSLGRGATYGFHNAREYDDACRDFSPEDSAV